MARRVVPGFLVVALAVWVLREPPRLPLFDFVEYWAAGRLAVEGHNPYDPEAIERLERAAGRTEPGVLMWNPPWTLPLVAPFGLLDVRVAHLLWLVVQFGALAAASAGLWRFFGGPLDQVWIAWLVGFTFLPSIAALTAGQVSPLLVLGMTAFLWAERAGRPVLAGMSTLLLAIKPHLTLLFFVALVLVEVRRRRASLLVAGALTGLAATAVALALNPEVLAHYWHTLTNRPPSQYHSPTLGTVLRLWLGEERFALQFVAPLLGLVWLVVWWAVHRRAWNWERHGGMVLLIALLTAAYGAWPFDLVLLLVPVLEVAVRSPRRKLALVLHVILNGLAVGLLVRGAAYFGFLWLTPAILCGVLLLRPPHNDITTT